MARIRMVTRTVEVNTYSVMACNIETAEVRVMEFKCGLVPVSVDPLKYLKKLYETDTLKLVSVVSRETETVLYGMPEDEFIAAAKILPPRAGQENT